MTTSNATRSIRLATTVSAMALLVAACGGTSIEAEVNDAAEPSQTSRPRPATTQQRPADQPESSSQPATSEPRITITIPGSSETPSSTDNVAASTSTVPAADADGPLGTIDDPLPHGDPDHSTFTYVPQFGDTEWIGTIEAMTATGFGPLNETPGDCYLIHGLLSPTSIDEGFVSGQFDTPSVGILAGGEYFDSGFGDCDPDPAREAGWIWLLDLKLTVDTVAGWYVEVLVPEGAGDVTHVVVGEPGSSDRSLYYSGDVVDATPATFELAGPPLDASVMLEAGARFTSAGTFADVTWDMTIDGWIETPRSRFNTTVGACVLVFGSITPIEMGEDASSGTLSAPPLSVIAEGRNRTGAFGSCDNAPAVEAGHVWILDLEPQLGVEVAFYDQLFFEGGLPDIEAIVVGFPSNADANAVLAVPLASIPSVG